MAPSGKEKAIGAQFNELPSVNTPSFFEFLAGVILTKGTDSNNYLELQSVSS